MRLGCSGTIILVLIILGLMANVTLTITLAIIIALTVILYVVFSNMFKERANRIKAANNIDESMSKETSFQFNSMVYHPITSPTDDVPNREMVLRTDQIGYIRSKELSNREKEMKASGYSMENIRVARINMVQSYNAQYKLYDRYYEVLNLEADITTVPNREMTVLLKQMVMSFYHQEFGLDLSIQSHTFDEKMIKKFVSICPEVNMSINFFDNVNITNAEFLNQRIDKGCLNAFKNIMIGYNL